MNYKYVFTNIIWIIFYLKFSQAKIGCKNEKNKVIDWYIIIKLPTGYQFSYLSSDSKNLKWQSPKYDLQNDKNMVAQTLRQTYVKSNDQVFYVYYNDDRPNVNSSSAGGHLKGVLNMDRSTGYWLVHSIPNFPTESQYIFNSSQSIYGQSIICVSMNTNYLQPIVEQLLMMYATVYSSNLPNNFSTDKELIQLLSDLVKNSRRTKLQTQKIQLKTTSSINLIHFGKSSKYAEDLYSGFMAPSLNQSLFTETWTNGKGDKLTSACDYKNKVNNIQSIELSNKLFKSTSDHSKWAISQTKSSSAVCVGDINRMRSQYKRGGGSLCIFLPEVWQRFYDAVKSYEKCGKELLK